MPANSEIWGLLIFIIVGLVFIAGVRVLIKYAISSGYNIRFWFKTPIGIEAEIEMLRAKAAELSEEVVARVPRRLIDVKPDVMHRGSSCTKLIFDEGPAEYMKVKTFDKDGRVTRQAEALKGQKVITTCWDPINEPGKWSKQNYFRQVLKA